MILVDNENIVCFDVDDTLVMWDIPESHQGESIIFDYFGFATPLLPHLPHIKLLKQFKARGQYVIVWSQGGSEWAAGVVKLLGLEQYVDIVMTKPKWLIDDLPVSAWTKVSYMTIDGKRVTPHNIEDEENVNEKGASHK